MNETTTEVPVPLKPCGICKVKLPTTDFNKNSKSRDGLWLYCRPCDNARGRTAYSVDPLKSNTRSRLKRKTPHGRAQGLVSAARTRSVDRVLPITITAEWVEERINRGVCEVTGIRFDLGADGRGTGFRKAFGPSLDQRIPGIGYTKENTQVVVWSYNAAKGTGSHEEVLALAKALCHVK